VTPRPALVKSEAGGGHGAAELDLAVQQIVSRAVVSNEIVDILSAARRRDREPGHFHSLGRVPCRSPPDGAEEP